MNIATLFFLYISELKKYRMKYLISDTVEHTMGEINSYFAEELKKTNLKKEDIVIEDSLKSKIAIMELQRIFDENGMAEHIEWGLEGYKGIHLKLTGNFIEFSDNELSSRFSDAYNCILNGLKGE